MSDQCMGEIRLFGGNYAPEGWALCNGQLMQISQYDALFSLIGTTYGGDGQTTFALPDLRGRVPVHRGTNPSTGTTYNVGVKGGNETVPLTAAHVASHSHSVTATTAVASSNDPAGRMLAHVADGLYSSAAPLASMHAGTIGSGGGSGAVHDNMQPSLCVNFIIALEGVYPTQS